LFILAGLAALALVVWVVLPGVFGFKPPVNPPPPPPPPMPTPWWFWVGNVVCLISVGLMWFGPPPVAMWMFVPAWWGLIVALDGLAWKLNGGKSLITTRLKEFIGLVVMSVLGWYLFEYLNYYAVEDWYYPNANLVSKTVAFLWYTLCYTTVWPAVAEWYSVLNSFSSLRRRWENGPRINLTRAGQVIVVVLSAVAMAIYGAGPYILYWVLWIGPLTLLSPVLTLLGYWTPYRTIPQGNWSRVTLAALAAAANAIFWESWNYGSEFFHGFAPVSFTYWKYNVPYLNVIHIFSEMPLLGYWGYLPFGIFCWIWWLLCVHLFGLNPDLSLSPSESDPS
jgi:hypothetical protein